MTLQTQLQELITLTLGVANGEVGLSLTVGGADDVGGLIDATLELSW